MATRLNLSSEPTVPIPQEHLGRHAYHFCHIKNLANLLKSGFLAKNHPNFPRTYWSIAAKNIQARRVEMVVPCGPGGSVHDYVPLYFSSLSPMLLSVINTKNVDQFDILYFEFPIASIIGPSTVFTDAAANTDLPPNFYNDPTDLSRLKWSEIDSLKWGSANKVLRQQRMAELLVRHHLPLSSASRCIVWNNDTKRRVEKILDGAPFPPIKFESRNRYHWFKNIGGNKKLSLASGPRQISQSFKQTCKEIAEQRRNNLNAAPFRDLDALLKALRSNLNCLPQTAELIGLRSENGVHKRTVDIHTQEVVAKLLTLPEYARLEERLKRLVELAAYLHDIGKGPRSRWDSNGGLQKVDPNHPVGAMPMMVDILVRQVELVMLKDAKILTKLVCYHDLVGDVLGKGRAKEQIVSVASDQEELDMLFAIGKADATVLVELWWQPNKANTLYNWCMGAIKARNARLE